MKIIRSRNFALNATSLAVFLGALDTYVIVSVLTNMMNDLDVALNKVQDMDPAITGYLLGYTVAMPLCGQISDRFGRKIVIQSGLMLFAIGSIFTAQAHSLTMLFMGRAIQGLAAGALLPVTMALVSDLWEDQRRVVRLGLVGGAQEFGALVGPLYGALITTILHSWRYIFWINVPLVIFSAILIQYGIRSIDDVGAGDANLISKKSFRQDLKIDIIGSVLLALSLSLIILGCTNAHPEKSLLAPHGIWFLLIALCSSTAFILWEVYSSHSLIERQSMHVLTFVSSLLVSFCVGVAMMVTLVDIELFARVVCQLSENQAIWLLARFLLAVPIGALLGGYIASRWNDRGTIIIGMLIAAFGFWRIAHWNITVIQDSFNFMGLKLPISWTDLIIIGLGLGLVISPVASAMLNAVTSEYHGLVSALVVVARTVGMLVGVTSLMAVGIRVFNQSMDKLDRTHRDHISDITQTVMREYKHAQEAYMLEYHFIFMITAVVCVLGVICALGISHKTLQSELTVAG